MQDCNPLDSDVKSSISTDADTILNKALETDVSTEISEPTLINDNHIDESNTISDAEFFKEYSTKLLSTSSPIMFEYHKSEIDIVNKIINSILDIAKWVSLITIIVVAVCIFFERDSGAIISGTIGGIIDTILGILTGLFNSTLKSKKSYFDSEIDSSKFSTMMLLVQTISDKEKKDTIIMEILRSHFNISGK